MDVLQFTNLNLFKSISMEQESFILDSKDSKYRFYINYKDEIKGVDNYELVIVDLKTNSFDEKSGTAEYVQKLVMSTLDGKDSVNRNKSNNTQFKQQPKQESKSKNNNTQKNNQSKSGSKFF